MFGLLIWQKRQCESQLRRYLLIAFFCYSHHQSHHRFTRIRRSREKREEKEDEEKEERKSKVKSEVKWLKRGTIVWKKHNLREKVENRKNDELETQRSIEKRIKVFQLRNELRWNEIERIEDDNDEEGEEKLSSWSPEHWMRAFLCLRIKQKS